MTTFRSLMLGTAAAGFAAVAVAGTTSPAVAADMLAGNDKVGVSLSGQVNRGVLFVNDDENTDVFFVDNENSSTRMRFKGEGKISEDLSAGFLWEMQMESNSSVAVSQSTENADAGQAGGTGTDINGFSQRHIAVYIKSKKFGSLWTGQASESFDSIGQLDMSGTGVAAYSSVVDLAGGYNVRRTTDNTNAGSASGLTVGSFFSDLDGARQDAIRYVSPTFAGVTLDGSMVQGGRGSATVKWSGEAAGTKIAAGLGYVNFAATSSVTARAGGSVAVLHDSGLNLAVSYMSDLDNDTAGADEAKNLYVKLGYQAKLSSMGTTAFSLDYTNSDQATNDREGESWGLAVVQNIDSAATELYGVGRIYEFDDNTTNNYEDIVAVMVGARVKF